MISSDAGPPSIPLAEGMPKIADARTIPSALWIIVALGAALRLIALGHKSFWLDEIASVVIARMPGNSFWWWVWHDEGNMALYYVMLRPWLHIHLGEATVRLLSVLPGIVSIPMMYLLGRTAVWPKSARAAGDTVPRAEHVRGGVFAGGPRLQLVAAGRHHVHVSVCAADRATDIRRRVLVCTRGGRHAVFSLFRIAGSAGTCRVAAGAAGKSGVRGGSVLAAAR